MKNWSFATNNDKLISLVLKGQKRATSYLYKEEDIPVIGEESIIHFDNEKDACIVKTINYKILKFKDIKATAAAPQPVSLEQFENVYEYLSSQESTPDTVEKKAEAIRSIIDHIVYHKDTDSMEFFLFGE